MERDDEPDDVTCTPIHMSNDNHQAKVHLKTHEACNWTILIVSDIKLILNIEFSCTCSSLYIFFKFLIS